LRAPELPDAETRLAQIAFSYVQPVAPAQLPASCVIEFRKRHAAERRRFQELSTALVEDLKGITNAEELEYQLRRRWKDDLKPALDDLERALKGSGIAAAMGAGSAAVQLPGAVAASLALVPLIGPALATAAGVIGVVVGLLPFWQQHRNEHTTRLRDAKVAYLYSIRRDLGVDKIAMTVREEGRRIPPPYI
jgi:Flp pilus assembly protein TadB